jgi:hypothetical protein
VLVENRLKGINDPSFLLTTMVYLFDSYRIYPTEYRLDELCEHTILDV